MSTWLLNAPFRYASFMHFSLSQYSRVSNNRVGGNNRVGVKISSKINKRVGGNKHVGGIFWEILINV